MFICVDSQDPSAERAFRSVSRLTVRSFYHADLRDIRREVPLMPFGNDDGALWEICDSEPTPDEVATLTETVERLLMQFPEGSRPILYLLLKGYPAHEISVIIGCTERMVYRLSERFKELMQNQNGEQKHEPNG